MEDRFSLHLGDCFEITSKWENKFAGLMITDPPYGISIVQRSNRLRQLGYRNIAGDDTALDVSSLLRLANNSIIFGGNYFHLPISPGWIVWDKQGGKRVDFADCELIWTSYDRPARIVRHIWDGFSKDSEKGEARVHPTQKPIAMAERLIRENTSIEDIVFDPFMGSGAIGVAAVRCGRRFIGCEVDEQYCRIAKDRIKKACLQGVLL